MFTTVDPAGLRADLQLVSGVQSDGKLYEWLSMMFDACTAQLASPPDACALGFHGSEICSPPLCAGRLIKANGGGW